MTTLLFTSDSEAVLHLRKADSVLGGVLDAIGPIELSLRRDRFAALARAIVGQQLSVCAAQTIWSRFVHLTGDVSAAAVAELDELSMRGAGLSRAKTAYLRDLAIRVLDGTIELDRLEALSDDAVIAELTAVKGIGRWTAEMFLIFSLGRPDVFALDDAGIRRAIRSLYGMVTSADDYARIAGRWKPYRSVASLCLWRALDAGLLDQRSTRLSEPAEQAVSE